MSSPRKVKVVVSDLKKYRDNVTMYRFKPEFQVKFKPGQFLHLALDNYDPSYNWPESRVFSIANSPEKDYIDILVSPKGKFTQRMINELKTGSKIWLKLPYGSFNLNSSADEHVILIAGGTGITPFISFLEYLLEREITYRSIKLYYGVRNCDLIIFDNTIERCRQRIPNFNYSIHCEHDIKEGNFKIHPGILPVEEIVQKASAMPGSTYYLSGPEGMIKAFEKGLMNAGISSERILFDKWE